MSTELVVEPEKVESVLPLLGNRLDEEGYIVDIESGERVKSTDDEYLTLDEIGYIGHGSVEPVRNDISSIVEYLSVENFEES